MKELRPSTLTLLLILSPVTGADTLTLLAWDHYVAPEVVKAWEQKTGHTLAQVAYDTEAARDTLLGEWQKHHLDLAILDEEAAVRFGQSGALTDLRDIPKPPRLSVFSSGIDRCGDHAMPYFWGTLGIVYRRDKLATAPDSWQVLFDPPVEAQGHIGLLDDPIVLPNSYLLWRGQRVDTADDAQWQALRDALLAQTANALTYEYAVTFLQTSPRADALYLAMGYSGDQHTLNELGGPDSPAVWEYVLPREGSMIWTDCLTIVAGSPRQEIAKSFLLHLNDPAMAALNASESGFATPSKAAFEHLPEAMKRDLTLYPPSGLLFKSQPYEILGATALTRREAILREVLDRFGESRARE